MEISSNQVEQIIKASKEGKESVTIEVPYSEQTGNWPQAVHMGSHMSNSLLKHGLINKPIEVIIKPNIEINERYGIEVLD